jgi:UDP-N-acetylmuramoyl-tripeptide--D-alanyl-D-alanine ligase
MALPAAAASFSVSFPAYFCRMKLEELYRIYLANPSIQTDTRKLQKNDLYFALKGPHFNGNSFAQKAIEAGAAYAVIDEQEYAIEGKTILVENVLETLQQLARHHRRQFDIPFLAITGSNGKTTTKELIHAVLSTTFKTYTTEGNLNNHIGIPLTLLKIKKDAEIAVIEMGANHQKEIEAYCLIALPTHGLITNVGKAHLEGFGGEEGVRKGKGELFDYLRQHNGSVFLMSDYVYLREMSVGIPNVFTYGTADADVIGNLLQSDPFLEVGFTKGFSGTVKTGLVGHYNLPNVLAAVAVGKAFGVEEANIKAALEAYAPSNSRSQLVQKGTNKIILDAYNANPSSMKAAIENFSKLGGENKILVLGAMAELGEGSVQEHAGIIDEIQKHSWSAVLLVGGDFLRAAHSFHSFSAPEEAGEWLRQKDVQNSYLLIKGSRSMQMEKVLNYL